MEDDFTMGALVSDSEEEPVDGEVLSDASSVDDTFESRCGHLKIASVLEGMDVFMANTASVLRHSRIRRVRRRIRGEHHEAATTAVVRQPGVKEDNVPQSRWNRVPEKGNWTTICAIPSGVPPRVRCWSGLGYTVIIHIVIGLQMTRIMLRRLKVVARRRTSVGGTTHKGARHDTSRGDKI